jgi:hypothetical protein
VLGIVCALPASRPGEGRSADGRAVINGRETLLCFAYAGILRRYPAVDSNLFNCAYEVRICL